MIQHFIVDMPYIQHVGGGGGGGGGGDSSMLSTAHTRSVTEAWVVRLGSIE